MFNRVHTLDLSHTNVIDVRALGGVHTLDLYKCYNIRDVGVLGSVHTLNLSHCFNVKDMRDLGKVHSLDLSYCINSKKINFYLFENLINIFQYFSILLVFENFL